MNKIPSAKSRNAVVKRRYLYQLKEARGMSDATIDNVVLGVGRYEEFSKDEDFEKFNESRAIGFRKYLERYRNQKGKILSLNTRYQTLRVVEKYFRWLMTQPGYRSKICADDIEFLKLDKKSARAVRTSRPIRRIPPLEYVKKLVESIKPENELDRRDRALISFTLLSGMRDGAIVSLPLSAFNESDLTVNQSPLIGVQTKFSKANHSRLMEFGDWLIEPIHEWVAYLKSQKLFSQTDPLFPASRQEFAPNTFCFKSINVETSFWSNAGPMRQIFKNRARQAGLEYFPPHSFRHLAIHLALDACKSNLDIRAVSQNVGHENIATTLLDYGALDDRTTLATIENMKFTQEDNPSELDMDDEELLEMLRRKFAKQSGMINPRKKPD